MAYFLKITKLKYGNYLAIYESHYDKIKKRAVNKNVRSLGNEKKLITSSIPDPVSYYRAIVKKMNEKAKDSKEKDSLKHIDQTPMKHLGYFPFIKILNSLNVKKLFDLLQLTRNFKFNSFEIVRDLIAARIVSPCSKLKTKQNVFPTLFNNSDASYTQILDCLDFIGNEYEKIIEFFNVAVKDKFKLSTDTVYFDCTNFYFEIDREDSLRRKGPSKENRNDPIVGMGVLLDNDCIPIGMKIFPGNESEKPVLRNIINELKKRNNITGRTVQVADKGLNCSENVISALKNNDGYIFSKSVKTLPEKEKIWLKLDNDWKSKYDNEGNLIYKFKSCVDKFPYYYIDEKGKKIQLNLKEKRVLTFNPQLAEKQKAEIYKLLEKAKNYCYYNAKKSECGECGKYLKFTNEKDEKAEVKLNYEAIDKDLELTGYNLLVSSEIEMSDEKIYSTYHNLWKIEETFRTMKSELDARPVFLQKQTTITGHFLICYLAVLLIRLFQYKIHKEDFSTGEIMEFARKFAVVEIDEDRYVNLLSYKPLYLRLEKALGEAITNYYLAKKQILKMLGEKA